MSEALANAEAVRFGPFRLDMTNRLLSRDGAELNLPPRAMGVLWLLVARAGQVVSKQDLLDEVWKDAFVSDTSLAEAVSLLRQVLGDDPQQPVYIQTQPRRGYRFVAAVTDERALHALPPPDVLPSSPQDERLWTPWVPYLLLFVAGLATGLAVMARARPAPTPPRGIVRFSIDLAGAAVDRTGHPIAITRRGDTMAFVVRDRQGSTSLRLRGLASAALRPVPESDGAAAPFFSPDGRFVAFFARGRLYRVPVLGGVPFALADAPAPLGGAWADDDEIVFASRWTGGLQAVPASGGVVRQVTSPDRALGELRHAWPDAIEGTPRVLFSIAYTPRAVDAGRIASVDLRTGELRRFDARATDARALPLDHLLLLAPALTAVAPVDSGWQMITGSSVGLPDRVQVDEWNGGAAVTIASTGVRAALDAPSDPPAWQFLSLTDGRGDARPGGLDTLDDLTVSPDGRRAAGIERYGSRADLWVVDLVRAVRTRLASAPRLVSPAWSPDGERIAFATSDGGPFHISTASADGSGSPQGLAPGDYASVFPSGWTPDGTSVVFTRVDGARGLDLGWAWSWPVRAGLTAVQPGVAGSALGAPSPGTSPDLAGKANQLAWELLATSADEAHAVVSPSGRWIAYETDDAGRWGIAVRPASKPGPVVVVAAEGHQPAWADERALVYLDGDRVMRVDVGEAVPLDPKPPVVVTAGVFRLARGVAAGGRVLAQTGLTTSPPSVTLEWFDELKARLEASQPPPEAFR